MKELLFILVFFPFFCGCTDNALEGVIEEPSMPGYMAAVQGGSFEMGDNFGDGSSDERPVHSVHVSSFYMSVYEITQSQYSGIMGDNPSQYISPNRPVENVQWSDAVLYCNERSRREGLEAAYAITSSGVVCDFLANGYRLPTEAEWEYAAKGGGSAASFKYAGSNSCDNVAWYSGNSDSMTHRIGLKGKNALGIYDLSGNVREWCWDWAGTANYYALSDGEVDPKGPAEGTSHVIRGGHYSSDSMEIRVSARITTGLSNSNKGTGFRVVRSH
jgi:formylglycine-generating enzyme required for sulfatase activity